MQIGMETENLSKKVNFLDLTITINQNGYISTKTYQKEMNLLLYIPSHSAHPPKSVNNLVYGLMKTYRLQNSRTEDFLNTVQLLFQRLMDRGYEQKHLKEVFMEAMSKLDYQKVFTKGSEKDRTDSPGDNIFFHLPYHPSDVSRSTIRFAYEQECETTYESADSFKHFKNRVTGGVMEVNKMTIAYHRPKNIRDVLVPSKLAVVTGKEVSRVLGHNFLILE